MNNNSEREVESKILEINHDNLKGKILNLGGKEIFHGILDAVWMQNVNGKKVRVRKEGDDTVTEYKEKIKSNTPSKECIEIGYSPDNYENQIKVFESLGLIKLNRSVKNRVSYLLESYKDLGDIRFDFDKYSDLDGMAIPELLEIEASSHEVIVKIAEVLGFSEEDLKDWGAGELSKFYRNKLNK